MSDGWVRCTKRHPCPICGKPDWCTYTEDGRVVLCMRVPNDHPSKGKAGGWVYKNGETADAAARSLPDIPERKNEHISTVSLYNLIGLWGKDTSLHRLQSLAKNLGNGVRVEALRRLGAIYCKGRYAWAFPMRDENGVAVGIRFRGGTRKYSLRGSRDGLFFDPAAKPATRAWLTEGPTDTAALMSIAPDELVIGRSSLLSPWSTLRFCLWRLGVKEVNICVDYEPKDATAKWPGGDGNRRLARFLGLKSRFLVPPGCKDVRAFVNAGGTLPDLAALLARPRGRGLKL